QAALPVSLSCCIRPATRASTPSQPPCWSSSSFFSCFFSPKFVRANLFLSSAARAAGPLHCRRRRSTSRGFLAQPGTDAPLLFRGKRKDVIHEQLGVVLVVAVEGCGCGAGEDPPAVLLLEKPGRHRRARADRLWVDDPALDPVGFQTPLGLQEIGRRRE